jgi:hypothetical protein
MEAEEKVKYFKSLEIRCQSTEQAVNNAKEVLKSANKAYDTAVLELRSAIRRKDDDELPFASRTPVDADHEVIGEDRQLPEHPIELDTTPEATLPENPGDDEEDEEEQDDAA